MKLLRIYPTSINSEFISQAVEALKNGEIILYPTDTLYALGCNALNQQAIERLCNIKGIDPKTETLSLVCTDISQASEYVRIDNNAFSILRKNLPGPFTFILPSSLRLPKVLKSRKELGLRIPDNPISRLLAEELGNPLMSTSIKLPDSGLVEISAEMASEPYASSHDIDIIIDGGDCSAFGSTVVDLTDSSSPEIIRQGIGELEL